MATATGSTDFSWPEVEGVDLTLREAVEEGIIPKPPLCNWNGWQQWRSDEGGRPAYPPQGANPNLRNWIYKRESRLRVELMELYYGADWREKLSRARASGTGPGSGPGASAGIVASELPLAEAEAAEAAFAQAQRLPQPTSSGQGETTPSDATALVRPSAVFTSTEVVPLTPGASSRMQSRDDDAAGSEGDRSWTSSMVFTLQSNEELVAEVTRPYDPAVETLEDFEKRTVLGISILEHRQAPVPWARLDRNCLAARYREELKLMTKKDGARYLRKCLGVLIEAQDADPQA